MLPTYAGRQHYGSRIVPEAIEHLLNAGREFLLAMTAVLGARADEAGGADAAPTLTRIDIE